MPKKISPDKITGLVALSYLVIIPVGAFIAWRKLQVIDEDLTSLCEKLNVEIPERPQVFPRSEMKRMFSR